MYSEEVLRGESDKSGLGELLGRVMVAKKIFISALFTAQVVWLANSGTL